jgi:hypothetical protein
MSLGKWRDATIADDKANSGSNLRRYLVTYGGERSETIDREYILWKSDR